MADLFLVDANNVLYRAAHAIGAAELSASINGEQVPTGALFGFFNSILAAWREVKGVPIVAWDSTSSMRKKQDQTYKARRMPVSEEERDFHQEVNLQRELAIELLLALGVRQVWAEGWEADDVMAFLVRRFAGRRTIAILSNDKDLYGCLMPGVTQLIAHAGSEFELRDRSWFLKEYPFEPEAWIEFRALMGDPSDDIPGVPGVGEKSALEAINLYGSALDAVKAADSGQYLGSKRVANRLKGQTEAVTSALAMLRPKRDLKLTWKRGKLDRKRARKMLLQLRFKTFLAGHKQEVLYAFAQGSH